MQKNIDDVFGEVQYKEDREKITKNYFKIPPEGGQVILRILPPFGSLKNEGKWAQYYAVHFGYKGKEGRHIPFCSTLQIVRTGSEKKVIQGDAALDRINFLRESLEKAKQENNKSAVENISKLLQIYNLKKAYYVNAIDLDGNIGLFNMPYRMFVLLQQEIAMLRAQGIDPISKDSGRFFVFSRYGSGPNTVHQVKVYRDANDVQVQSPITPVIANKMLKYGFDLKNLYIAPTAQEVEEIVKNNGGDYLDALNARYTGAANEKVQTRAKETASGSIKTSAITGGGNLLDTEEGGVEEVFGTEEYPIQKTAPNTSAPDVFEVPKLDTEISALVNMNLSSGDAELQKATNTVLNIKRGGNGDDDLNNLLLELEQLARK